MLIQAQEKEKTLNILVEDLKVQLTIKEKESEDKTKELESIKEALKKLEEDNSKLQKEMADEK